MMTQTTNPRLLTPEPRQEKVSEWDGIRILHLIERYYPRGAELFASRLASYLARRGFHTALCGLFDSNSDGFPISDSVASFRIDTRQNGPLAELGFQPSVLLNLIKVLRKFAPDVVIAHGSDTLKYSAIASLFWPRPLMLYRNIGIASFWAGNSLKTAMNRKLVRLMDAVVSVSETSREDFIRHYRLSPNRVHTIPNGIDLTPYQKLEIGSVRRRIRGELGLKEEDIILISVGSLSSEKNLGELLILVRELEKLSPRLFIVGDGPMRKELEHQAEDLGIRERVRFWGLQSEVALFLAASDIFLLPSKSEGMPAVIIEAGLAGLPSVAYDVGGVREVIVHNETGIIVPPGNHEEFKAALVSLLENPQKRLQMGSLARKEYPNNFGMEKIAEEHGALIKSLLTKKKRNMAQ